LAIVRSRYGRVLVAIRENEERTRMLGYDTFANKLAAVVISGVICAASGAAYALLFGYVGSSFASVQYSILPLLWVLLGGAATTLGPLLGTLFMYYVIDITSGYTSAYLLIVGALILLVLFFPQGHSRQRCASAGSGGCHDAAFDHQGPVAPFRRSARRRQYRFLARCRARSAPVIGPNGAGKTTFVSLVSGRIRAECRQIVFDGADITDLPAYAPRPPGIAYTFQITSVYANLTVYENVALPVQLTLRTASRRCACGPLSWRRSNAPASPTRPHDAGRAIVLRPSAPARSGDGPGAEAASADPRRADARPGGQRDRRVHRPGARDRQGATVL
jgi:hypothetical protein